jgi:hypothetical protein
LPQVCLPCFMLHFIFLVCVSIVLGNGLCLKRFVKFSPRQPGVAARHRHLHTDSKNDITGHLRRQYNRHQPASLQRQRLSLLILRIPASKYRDTLIAAASLTRKHTSICHLSSPECKQYGNVATIQAGLGEIRIGFSSFMLSTLLHPNL